MPSCVCSSRWNSSSLMIRTTATVLSAPFAPAGSLSSTRPKSLITSPGASPYRSSGSCAGASSRRGGCGAQRQIDRQRAGIVQAAEQLQPGNPAIVLRRQHHRQRGRGRGQRHLRRLGEPHQRPLVGQQDHVARKRLLRRLPRFVDHAALELPVAGDGKLARRPPGCPARRASSARSKRPATAVAGDAGGDFPPRRRRGAFSRHAATRAS